MGALAHKASETDLAALEHDISQFLTFFVADERLAIGILDVKEIIEVGGMTRIPMMPPFIRGVINLRGNVVPVIDLSARLGRERIELTRRSCIVLVEINSDGNKQSVGMLVDQVNEILEIAEENIQPPPDFGSDIRTDFIQAMGRVDDEFIILLAINHVLSVEELSALDAVRRNLETKPPADTPRMEGAAAAQTVVH